MVDRQLGNVFKMDRHAYVGRCYHGFRELDHDQRRQTYRNEKINLSSDRFEWIDTLFGLPEAVMYTTLVDWADRTTGTVDYDKLMGDIRTAIDEAHRDDTLKSVIKADLPAYIVKDPLLGETLHKFRSSGKKLFVLTNSLWDYTDVVMTLPARRRAQGVPVVAQLLRHRDRRRRQAGVLQRAAPVRADRSGDQRADGVRTARSSTSRATRSTRAATSSRSSR